MKVYSALADGDRMPCQPFCIAAIGNLPKVEFEKMIDGYAGFICIDESGEALVSMHWEHRYNHMVGRYNSIFRVQMPNITPHVCRHTYCSNP